MAEARDEVERLHNHLLGAVQRALRMCNEFSIYFPADLPSSILAALAREQSDIPFLLIHSANGPSTVEARRMAKHLGLSLVERHAVPNERRPIELLRAQGLPSDAGLEAFARAAVEARLHGPRFWVAEGALGLFERVAEADPLSDPRRRAEIAIAEALGLQLRQPFLDRGVLPFLKRLSDGNARPLTVLHGLAQRLGIAEAPFP